MTSGQWTMGAMTKVRVWAPRERASPSFTVTEREDQSPGKYLGSMEKVLALPTSSMAGNFSSRRPMLPAWSGSRCWITR